MRSGMPTEIHGHQFAPVAVAVSEIKLTCTQLGMLVAVSGWTRIAAASPSRADRATTHRLEVSSHERLRTATAVVAREADVLTHVCKK